MVERKYQTRFGDNKSDTSSVLIFIIGLNKLYLNLIWKITSFAVVWSQLVVKFAHRSRSLRKTHNFSVRSFNWLHGFLYIIVIQGYLHNNRPSNKQLHHYILYSVSQFPNKLITLTNVVECDKKPLLSNSFESIIILSCIIVENGH